MPDKQEVLDSITKGNYNKGEVRHLVNSVKTLPNIHAPSKLRVGDVYTAEFGLKKRPLVVIAVREKLGVAITVPLTTTEDELSLIPYSSRFFGEGFFTNQLVVNKIEYIKDSFVGVLESRQSIRNVKQALKEFYKGIL